MRINDGQKLLVLLVFLGIVFIVDGLVKNNVAGKKTDPILPTPTTVSQTPTQTPTVTTAPPTPAIKNTINSIRRPGGTDDNQNNNQTTDN